MRFTTSVTKLSRRIMLQVCGILHDNWSIACKQRCRLLSCNLAFRRTSILISGRHSLLNVLCQQSSLSMNLSFQIARRKVVFLRQFFQAFCLSLLVLKGQTRCPKNYYNPRGLYKANLWLSESFWSTSNSGSSSPSAMFFICRVAAFRDSQSQALNSNLLRDKL